MSSLVPAPDFQLSAARRSPPDPEKKKFANRLIMDAFRLTRLGQEKIRLAKALWLLALRCSEKGDHTLTLGLLKCITFQPAAAPGGGVNIQVNQQNQGSSADGVKNLLVPTPEQLAQIVGLAERLRIADSVVLANDQMAAKIEQTPTPQEAPHQP